MKYFSPSYWFKLWVLSAPLFQDKTQGINVKSIDTKNIKDWASKNTTNILVAEHQPWNFTNYNQTDFIINNSIINTSITTELSTIMPHKHRHEKHRNRHKIYTKWKRNYARNKNRRIK
ncbi:hypothetical protein [Spiroplasma endosymbiont of Nebria brevicollis]|uniref:hypothetical protein n=1 Tax=Spiroplasma endosymbiont of Nebria brevicollis TaxID=3066284 RepID=UPI00313AB1D7